MCLGQLFCTKEQSECRAVTQVCGRQYLSQARLLALLIISGETLTASVFIITALQFFVELIWVISIVQRSAFSNIWSLLLSSLLCAGPHQTTRLKTWCSWSWATLIPTFSCWWDSWKDSTARWTSTRTPSECTRYCSSYLASWSSCCRTALPIWCLPTCAKRVCDLYLLVCQHADHTLMNRIEEHSS